MRWPATASRTSSATPTPTYLAADTLFLVVGLLARLVLLRRALRVDPQEALRLEQIEDVLGDLEQRLQPEERGQLELSETF